MNPAALSEFLCSLSLPPQVFHYAVTSLSQVWRLKFSNIHCLANLLAGLKPYQVNLSSLSPSLPPSFPPAPSFSLHDTCL